MKRYIIITKIDCEVAYELLVFALFKEVKPKKREKKAKTGNSDSEESDGDTAQISAPSLIQRSSINPATLPTSINANLSRSNMSEGYSSQTLTGGLASDILEYESVVSAPKMQKQAMHPDRTKLFRMQLNNVRSMFSSRGESPTLTFDEVFDNINTNVEEKFTRVECNIALEEMSNSNMLWWQSDLDSIIFY